MAYVEADSVTESMAERMEEESSGSADGVSLLELVSAAASWASDPTSLLAKRLKLIEASDCAFERATKGETVVRERDLEMKEVEGEEIARKAERRMRCLLSYQ